MLKPNQQAGSVQAFDLMAGWLQPAPPNAAGVAAVGEGARSERSTSRHDLGDSCGHRRRAGARVAGGDPQAQRGGGSSRAWIS